MIKKFFKNILPLCMLIFALSGCSKAKPAEGGYLETAAPTAASETSINPASTPSPIETEAPAAVSADAQKWINNSLNGDKMILTAEEIKAYNAELIQKCDALEDILSIPESLSAAVISDYITAAPLPALPKYNYGEEISASELASFLSNRNLETLSSDSAVRAGVVAQRANLRTLPTSHAFFKTANDRYYDQIQETELIVGTPVWILHVSRDSAFYYVQSYFYRGWVRSEDIAEARSKSEWLAFAQPERFAVVTEPLLRLSDYKLDMGVVLPYQGFENGGYSVLLPVRDSSGYLSSKTCVLPKNAAHIGFLEYTLNNIYIQAFKYKGTAYGWGGMNDGVDCSGFVNAVFRSCGFMFPRNTGQQRKSLGNIVDLSGLGAEALAAYLDDFNAPTLLYKSGHVMLYLGGGDGAYHIIHAPDGGLEVSEAALELSNSNLLSASIIN